MNGTIRCGLFRGIPSHHHLLSHYIILTLPTDPHPPHLSSPSTHTLTLPTHYHTPHPPSLYTHPPPPPPHPLTLHIHPHPPHPPSHSTATLTLPTHSSLPPTISLQIGILINKSDCKSEEKPSFPLDVVFLK